MSSKNVVLSVADWDTSAIKYMAPKVNDKGGKSINIVSKQTNRSLHLTTPLLMTWGISDFVDGEGVSDGKYSISLNFPNDEYRSAASDDFLTKLKAFEQQILQDAVNNSELWWGEHMSLELCKHTFFPFLKYSKNKDTKKIDYTKPPSIRAKVPCYDGKWGVEIYNTNSQLIFPNEDPGAMPMDFVTKLSSVACGIQCSGIWIGGKGWGLTWKMFQCIVKPKAVVSIYGKCHIQLSTEDKDALEKQGAQEEAEVEKSLPVPVVATKSITVPSVVPMTEVDDSDAEDEQETVAHDPEPAVESEPVVEEPEPVQAVAEVAPVVKKIVKKVAVPVPAPVEEPVAEQAQVQVPSVTVKKIIKKKVV
jgi:hypothetical protein